MLKIRSAPMHTFESGSLECKVFLRSICLGCAFVNWMSHFQNPHSETCAVDEWNAEAKYNHQAEQLVVKTLKKYIILRPAMVYGIGDKTGISKGAVQFT